MGSLYEIIWFYSEWFLPPEKRRPFTYIMRDIYYKVPLIVITLGAIGFYLLGRYTNSVSILVLLIMVLVLFAGMVLAHLFWGKDYKPDQQEDPTYTGED